MMASNTMRIDPDVHNKTRNNLRMAGSQLLPKYLRTLSKLKHDIEVKAEENWLTA